MLREPQDLGADGMSFVGDAQSLLEADERSAALGYTHSMIGSRAGSVVGGHRAASPSQSLKSARMSHLDAPIQDDGFGGMAGASGTGHDMLAGGLFEDSSLFDDAPPTMPPSEQETVIVETSAFPASGEDQCDLRSGSGNGSARYLRNFNSTSCAELTT